MRSLVLLAAFVSSAAFAENFNIDPAHTEVVFKVGHMGFSNVIGQFTKVDGKFTLDEKNPGKSSVELTIDADSVSTNNAKRDEHLRSPDFFNVKQFPKITFKSKSVKKTDGNHYEVAGDLTMHGVTKPVSFSFNHMGTGADPMGKVRAGGELMFKVKRSDFGMNFMAGPKAISDEIEVMVDVEGVKS